MKRLRLIKVVVQPVFVLDDGDTIQEMPHPPIEIPAADWPTYSGGRFPREVAAWEEQINAESTAAQEAAPAADVAGPNRAARRAAARPRKRA